MTETTRAERLQAFMQRYEATPTTWGADDCSASAAKWLEEETGIRVDFPVYATQDEGLAIKRGAGGLLPIWQERLDAVRVHERYGEPQLGDIGIIDTRLYGQIGFIALQASIIAVRRADAGWHFMGPIRKFVKVWAVE